MSSIPIAPHRSHGDLVYTAGQIGVEDDGSLSPGFSRQMNLALRALSAQLEAAGASLATALKVTVFIVRRDDFAEMNTIFGEWFGERWPPRTTVVTDLALPELLFEIEAVAVRARP